VSSASSFCRGAVFATGSKLLSAGTISVFKKNIFKFLFLNVFFKYRSLCAKPFVLKNYPPKLNPNVGVISFFRF
jgi:hypothetical protein